MSYKNVPARHTSEFEHYPGCRMRDPDNCSGCALTTDWKSEENVNGGPNYAAWTLSYIENHRVIPAKWRKALIAEMEQTNNIPYAENIKKQIEHHGILFSDGKGL